MTTYIKEIFDLPEQVGHGDFVMPLTRGVADPSDTLGNYVVTEQLASAFEKALKFIGGAVDTQRSRASYLHGSFGSGKSHFMAVLHLLLQGNTEARSIPELANVVAQRLPAFEGKKFLLVPYHMIGAQNMESAILGRYAEHVQTLRPDAPTPAVFVSESILANAKKLRAKMGDESFFAALNGGDSAGAADGWGSLGGAWNAQGFEEAAQAPAMDERRLRLVSTLLSTLLTSFAGVTDASGRGFVSLDDGLAVISQHAKALGYDAVILFLDELILWLASRAADQAFVSTEGQKLAKLVESEASDRPIPIISFVARQRDLRELVGEHIAGADQLRFADVLSHWDGRFHTINLEDRNLPKIAEKRVLRPVSEEARRKLDDAFAATQQTREEILRVLLTDESDLQSFRQIYPFSPALMETLVAVSSVLQRERTALKVMLQLLVDQRDTLELGQVVPVGDLFDVIAEGDEPFTEGMRLNFENAKKLWHTKLQPMLEKEHGKSAQELRELGPSDATSRAFRANGRLLKTLLLAALAPEVKALKSITSERLVALNHGSIKTPIPGQESQEVLSRLRRWAGQVGEIKISDDPVNPIISIQIYGVDTESIIENNRAADNQGNRRKKVRELLFGQLRIRDMGELQLRHETLWRGTQRPFDIVFGNVRELPEESLRARESDRKVVIDFPFDPDSNASADDLARLEDFRSHGQGSRTLVWLPSFLSLQGQRDLGNLVILDDLLTGERFEQCSSHLSATDRGQARSILENQRSQLRQRILAYLEGAYGVAPPPPGSLDQSHALEHHFQSLLPGFSPRPPVGANLGAAFEHLLHQVLDNQYPSHPHFEEEARSSSLSHVFEQVERAVQADGGRVTIEQPLRKVMRGLAVPLELGEMGETHFVLGTRWVQHFDREAAKDQVEGVSVGRLRKWMDRPSARGLPKEVQNLVISTYATQTNRSFFLHGAPISPDLKRLEDEIELRTERLPNRATWEEAVARAATVFGLAASRLLNATNKTKLASDLATEAQQLRQPADALIVQLQSWVGANTSLTDPEQANRLKTARCAKGLLEAIHAAGPGGAIEALVEAPLETSAAAVGTSLKKASEVSSALASTEKRPFEALPSLSGEREAAARRLLRDLEETITSDEYAVGLAPKLRYLYQQALDIILPPKPTPPPPDLIESGEGKALSLEDAIAFLEGLRDKSAKGNLKIDVTWRLHRREDKA
jgi:hypothetical protein